VSLPHFFAPSTEGERVSLTGDEARHARSALRIREGEDITVSDGAGRVVRATVTSAASTLDAVVTARTTVPAPRPRVVVYPAIPKSGKLDLVVEKLTELGVDEIRPWFAARTVVRWDARQAASRAERWRAIAFAAAKQSRRAWLPVVAAPAGIESIEMPAVVLHEESGAPLADAVPSDAEAVGIVLGPEGGLAPEEVARLESLGARTAGLGSQILRAETAAIVAAALVLARLGRLG
jgi:16S rRNA (uracil1498-N3)-methyltransferase